MSRNAVVACCVLALSAWTLAPPAGAGALLPAGHSPVDAEVGDAVPLEPLIRKAIRMFDATAQSDRHYDLVACLDGLTFAFGNFPQMQLLEFFQELRQEKSGATYQVLLARLAEHFNASADGWTKLKSRAGIDPAASPSADAIDKALAATLLNATFMKRYARKFNVRAKSDTKCDPAGNNTSRSFFDDQADWFRPAFQFAFRDSDVVAFQVRYWENHYIKRAVTAAAGLKLPDEKGAILMAFIRSNPGQVRDPPRTTLLNGKAPASIPIAGRAWRWDGTDRPAALMPAGLDDWRLMLIWQVMCWDRDRIRSRNAAYYAEYLAPVFTLPVLKGKLPAEHAIKDNCDPARVKLAS